VKRLFDWAYEDPDAPTKFYIKDAVTRMFNELSVPIDEKTVPKLMAKRVISVLAQNEKRWRMYPEEHMTNDAKTFRYLYNQVDYCIRNRRQKINESILNRN
jgi:hypothetical protein